MHPKGTSSTSAPNDTTRNRMHIESQAQSYPITSNMDRDSKLSKSLDTHSQPHVIIPDNSSPSSDNSVSSKDKKMRNDHKNVSLFGVDLSHLSASSQALILCVMILCGFISIGYVEEGFKFEFENFSFGWFMTAIELVIFSVFAMIERLLKGLAALKHRNDLIDNQNSPNHIDIDDTENESLLTGKGKGITSKVNSPVRKAVHQINWIGIIFEKQMPLKYHFIVAVAMMCSRALTNIALLLLNYPTQVIFKSMKLISVMIGSVCCLKQSYHHFEYIAAPLLVLSAVLFTLGDANDLNFNVLGIVVVLVSLIFDAIHANSQQYILRAKTERDTTMELLVFTNLIAGVVALAVSVATGEVGQIANVYLPSQPEGTLRRLFLWFGVRVGCLYVGVSAFVVFTKRFGAVFAVTITTIRKVMTVLLSWVFYPGKKQFVPMQHGSGTLLFMLSLMLWGYGSVKKKEAAAAGKR